MKKLHASLFLAVLPSVQGDVSQTANPAPAEGQGAPAAQPRARAEVRTPCSADSQVSGPASSGPSRSPQTLGLEPGRPQPRAPAPVPPCGVSPAGARGRRDRGGPGSTPRSLGSRGRWGERRGGGPGRSGAAAVSREPSLLGVRRPPGAAMEVYIPSFRYEESDLERGYTVGAGPGARAEAAESGRCPSGRRRPRAGVPARSPPPPPPRPRGRAAPWGGCQGNGHLPPAVRVPRFRPSYLPAPRRVWEPEARASVGSPDTALPCARRPASGARLGCVPRRAGCSPCPDTGGFAAGGCGLPSPVGFIRREMLIFKNNHLLLLAKVNTGDAFRWFPKFPPPLVLCHEMAKSDT